MATEQAPGSDIHQWTTSAAGSSTENREKYLTTNKSAFVLGYTGECGKALVNEIIQNNVFSKVVLIGRRNVDYEDEEHKQLEQRVIDFDNLENYKDSFAGFDVGFCCLGTVYSKGGYDELYKVSHLYVLNCAAIAKEAGCGHFHWVSGKGANHKSKIPIIRMQGQVEEDLKMVGLDRLTVYQPGLLMCNRTESRPFETALKFLMKPVQAAFPTALTIPTTTLATAMINATVTPSEERFHIIDNKFIHYLAGYGQKPVK